MKPKMAISRGDLNPGPALWRVITLWTVLLACTGLLVVSCSWDPQRDNPYDPGSNVTGLDTSKGLLQVTIKKMNKEPLEGARLIMDENGLETLSDADGVAELPAPTGMVHFEVDKEGYSNRFDSLVVTFGDTAKEDITLKGLPVIDSLRIFAGLEHLSLGGVNHTLFITAYTDHPDNPGAIERVTSRDPVNQTVVNMQDLGNGIYNDSLDFGIGGEAELVERLGVPFTVTVYDTSGDSAVAEGSLLQFFQYDIYRDVDPFTFSDTVRPIFYWPLAEVNFTPLRYRLFLFRQQGFSLLTDTLVSVAPDTMSGDSLSVELDHTLENGNYYWQLTLYDALENWVRSPVKEVVIF